MRAHFSLSVKLLAVIFLAVAVLAGMAYAYLSPQTYTITRTNTGFSPERLTINKGDTVIFVNSSISDSWPASDSHPSHGRYSDFDPTHAIQPGDPWEFTFSRAGVWPFHDHMHPMVQGRIIVLGYEGESVEACLDSSTDTIKAYCWDGEIDRILKKGGLDAVFDAFEKWNAEDPLFQRNCHDVSHYIGIQTYQLYKAGGAVADRIETTYCNFGFYHGFMEQALRDTGDEGVAQTVAYCEKMRDSTHLGTPTSRHNAVGACYHGIGHALFDSIDSTKWGDEYKMAKSALLSCESAIQPEWERTRCASGVFNSLSIALGSGEYGISFRHDDPLGVCRAVPEYWTGCAIEIGVGYIRHNKYSLEDGFSLLRQIPVKAARLESMQALINDEVRRRVGEPEFTHLAKECSQLMDQEEWAACILGVVSGFFHRETPEKGARHSIAFCGQFTLEQELLQCQKIVLVFAKASDPQLVEGLCGKIDAQEHIPECSNQSSY